MSQEYRIIFGVSLMLVALVVLVAAFAVVTNDNCQGGFWDTLQVYPGAELVEEDRQFLGAQRAVYYTPDVPGAVNQWYTQQRAEQMRAVMQNGNVNTLPVTNWDIAAAQGREGTTVTFKTTCP